mmetsp:Transcript_18500/g.32066  ORF Transcript_18500/g.32066 Transcript_18500/m.32066 type:complete len:1142 (+) Transcript_18500:48-3473(+)
MDTKDSYTNMERAATSPGASGSSVSINVGVPSGTVNLDVLYNMIERKDLAVFNDLGGTEGIATSLTSNLSKGLQTEQVHSHTQMYGVNQLPEQETVTFLGLVKEALADLMMRLLIIAAIISIIFGMFLPDPYTGEVNRKTGWIEGTAILMSVTIVVMVSAVNDYNKAKKFEEMSAEQSKKDVEVMRNGVKTSVDISELVVGDVMFVAAGMSMAADGVFLQGQDLKCDESAVTGETDIMKKSPAHDPFFISGTNVTEGEGLVLIINVGVNSFAGKLAMATRGSPADTPLQVKLGWLAEMIGKLGLAAAVLTFAVLSVKTVVSVVTWAPSPEQPDPIAWSVSPFLNHLLVSITLVVVAIPEGLPLAVTIALAYSMKSMMADNCLVRVLASCETMGGTNTICSDKTGTLTTNSMTVVQGWLAEDNFAFSGYGVTGGPNSAITESGAATVVFHSSPEQVDLMCEALALNSTCDELNQDGKMVWVGGNKTEHGLVGFVKRIGKDYKAMRNQYAAHDKRTYPFSSAKKRMTTIVRKNGKWLIFVKGASEMVLEDCTHVLSKSGEVMPADEDYKAGIIQVIQQMADQGNRTMAVAYAESSDNGAFPAEEPYPALTLLAITGIQDPIRVEVPDAVASCRKAGIQVRMVTGDNKNTAVAIARKCGLLRSNGECEEGEVMEGAEFRKMAAENPERLQALIPKLRVLARSSPTDKLVLVACLMDEGDIVAVTGDGTNDAPALKLADVGFAMKSGTDVATGAADMVLMDDNFSTVVRAAVWGRTVNDNIRKFLQFQLTVNVAGVLLTLIGSAIYKEEPLKAVQLLWLNLIMDTLAALALATERPARDCLESGQGPISRAAPLISNRMWVFVITHGAFQLAVMILLIEFGPGIFNTHRCEHEVCELVSLEAQVNMTIPETETILCDPMSCDKCSVECKPELVQGTCMFNTFIWFQLFNEFNARKLYGERNIFEGFGRSRLFCIIFFICIGVQFLAVQVFGPVMKTTPLYFSQWVICISIAAMELLVGLIVSFIQVPMWKPKTADANKQGLDDLKKRLITEAKTNAGMFGGAPVGNVGQPSVTGNANFERQERGPRERWEFAIAGVMAEQRVVSTLIETTDRRIATSMIRKRRDSSILSFQQRTPAAGNAGLRVV